MTTSIQDLRGKVVLVAGGTAGIGRSTAEALARRGATLVIVGRNRDKGAEVVRGLQTLGGQAEFIAADLSLMTEVRRVAAIFRQKYTRLDILVQCADILTLKRIETAEGFEAGFATNYLSRFLLVNLLLDLLKSSAPARIIHIAAAGIPGKLNLAQIPPTAEVSAFKAHNNGQRANDLFGVELAERLRGTGVTVNILNPGIVDSDIRRRNGAKFIAIMEFLMKPVTMTPDQYAQIVASLATTNQGEQVLFNRKRKPLKIGPNLSDRGLRQQLWASSEKLTSLTTETETTASATARSN